VLVSLGGYSGRVPFIGFFFPSGLGLHKLRFPCTTVVSRTLRTVFFVNRRLLFPFHLLRVPRSVSYIEPIPDRLHVARLTIQETEKKKAATTINEYHRERLEGDIK